MPLVNIDSAQIEQAVKKAGRALQLVPQGIEKVTSHAMNRTITGIRTDIVKTVCGIYNVPQWRVRNHISIFKSNRKDLRAHLRLEDSKNVSLMRYGGRSVAINRKMSKRKGATVQVHKTGARKPIHGAFIAKGRNHATLIFKRDGKERNPIHALYGPGYPNLFKDDDIRGDLQRKAEERFEKNFFHHAQALINGIIG